jgi:hypothetical protein
MYSKEGSDHSVSTERVNVLTCPNCQTACRVGELLCPKCHSLLDNTANTGSTRLLETAAKVDVNNSNNNAFGMVFIEAQKQITFEIDRQQLVLPVVESLIVGRKDEDGQPSQPDIGLNEYGAAMSGVSRQHIKITRQRDMIYVTDMGSRNGTYINSRHIHPHTRHILRSGDELRLGHLIVRVSF